MIQRGRKSVWAIVLRRYIYNKTTMTALSERKKNTPRSAAARSGQWRWKKWPWKKKNEHPSLAGKIEKAFNPAVKIDRLDTLVLLNASFIIIIIIIIFGGRIYASRKNSRRTLLTARQKWPHNTNQSQSDWTYFNHQFSSRNYFAHICNEKN